MALKFGPTIRELRIHLCQTSKASQGVRDFIQQNYVNIKKSNPKFPILIRECNGVQPRVYARYDKGVENSAPLTNLSGPDVLTTIKKLVN